MKKEEITLDDVSYLAGLSGLEFDEKEMLSMHKEVVNVVNLLNGCEEVVGDNSRSTIVLSLDQLREDERQNCLSPESVFMDRDCNNGFFVVNKGDNK